MMESIKFGDVFVSKGDYYVYLALQDNLLYVAKILDDEAAEKIERLFEIRTRQGGGRAEKANDNILFSYVVLKTEEFKNKMCHFKDAKDGKDSENDALFDKLIGPLDKEDLTQIKDEIINGPVSKLLKDLIRDIDIS